MSSVRRPPSLAFNENSPRPPVPGEETEPPAYTATAGGTQQPSSPSSWSALRYAHKGGSSPVLTPRRSSLANAAAAYSSASGSDAAPLGFEPEGSCLRLSMHEHCGSPPAYLRWARHLHALLEDSEGVELFRRYLDGEGRNHSDTLNFWFACEGLKKQRDPDKIAQLIKVIHRRYFQKTQLAISEELRREVNRRVKEGKSAASEDVFDGVQSEVERLINITTYPNFLKSEMYLQHVQAMQGETPSSGSSSGSSSGTRDVLPSTTGMLPTLHEDSELVTTPPSLSTSTSDPLPLTRDMLMATQKRRANELRPKPEAYAGVYLQHVPAHSGTHFPHLGGHLGGQSLMAAAYSSYNPVSRQDSELQSLSSDARTESDNMSLTDSSVDGMSLGRGRISKKQHLRHCRLVKESASMNHDPHMRNTVIPRTQRVQREQCHPMSPAAFAAILTDKLEGVLRDREAQDKLERKLLEGDCAPLEAGAGDGGAPPRTLADAIREKLHDEDDNDQDILDQHVSRVWSDLTPLPSPGLASPRPKSPDGSRGRRTAHYVRHPRKDKDVFSTFSSDSGNVHDFADGSEHKHHLPKSKSMPDYQQELHCSSLGRGLTRGSSASKKTLTDTTDSGVSVVSDSSRPPTAHCDPAARGSGAPCGSGKDNRVLTWLLESHEPKRGKGADSAGASSQHSRHSAGRSRTTGERDRAGSQERAGVVSWPGPAQPFVADPSMPPLPLPHTDTQLEEARRRLMEDDLRSKTKSSRFSGPSKSMEASTSNQSTLRKASRPRQPAPVAAEESTVVVFSFCDELVPYRTKIPSRHVTLRQFKEFLPKKGSYRFFFKTECEDLDMRVIQEEVTDDSEILPLWEGKVMAAVKPVD